MPHNPVLMLRQISQEMLNLAAAGVCAEFKLTDGLAGVDGPVDLMVANPPYIAGDGGRTHPDRPSRRTAVMDLLTLALSAAPAHAIPAFARKYKASCAMCHRFNGVGANTQLNIGQLLAGQTVTIKALNRSFEFEQWEPIFMEISQMMELLGMDSFRASAHARAARSVASLPYDLEPIASDKKKREASPKRRIFATVTFVLGVTLMFGSDVQKFFTLKAGWRVSSSIDAPTAAAHCTIHREAPSSSAKRAPTDEPPETPRT